MNAKNTGPTKPGQKLTGTPKMLVEFGPLAIFMAAYFLGKRFAPAIGNMVGQNWSIAPGSEIYLAIGLFMPAFAIAFIYSVWRERRIAPMLLISGVIITVMGTMTLVLKDKTFFYMKPTMVYLLFASLLAGGLFANRMFLKTVFDEAFAMPDLAWRKLTVRFVFFFLAMALINEGAWRWLTRDCVLDAATQCSGEAVWVNLKIFGFTALSIVFTGLQIPYIMKHATDGPGIENED